MKFPGPPRLACHAVLRFGVAVACTLVCGPAVEADQARATLSVGARVLPSARLSASLPAAIVVAPRDIDAGFVDAPAGARLDIHTNARGVILTVAPLAAPFRAVAITGFDTPVALGSDGGAIVQRISDRSGSMTVALRCRFLLGADALPGQYAWPLRLGVQPLQ
jgi:hypothetical protein